MKPAPRFKRGGPGLWIEAAYVILAQDGHEALTIEQLTTRTEKTRGSFYHHFGSIDGFVSRLLADWRERNTERIVRLAECDPEPGARRTLIHHEALRLDARIEIAIRNWAGTDRRVLGACSDVDRRRMDVLTRDRRCCTTLTVEDSHRESMRLDMPHEQAITRPLPHYELVQLHCFASQARVFADLAGQGDGLARAA
ncbi:hypothetical protein AX760_25555 [Pararhizobium antarcticum]|uniref:HTH tetR-type domain-containing protein n=1 Tax=Pararhizobium antarcticum TaxID=1798805 RepID=A0A657LWN1_9HYPH|nr:hypothetical protein AX760_25555 [Pararhizobium antarcticum]